MPSVLWRCWLGSKKGIWPVKKLEWWFAGVVICLERGADLLMAQLIPLPLTVSCFSEIQISLTFLVLAHLGSPGQKAVKWVCVCVCVCVLSSKRNVSYRLIRLFCFQGGIRVGICKEPWKVSNKVIKGYHFWPWVYCWLQLFCDKSLTVSLIVEYFNICLDIDIYVDLWKHLCY